MAWTSEQRWKGSNSWPQILNAYIISDIFFNFKDVEFHIKQFKWMQINRDKHFLHQIKLEFLRNPTVNVGHTPTGNVTYKTGSE